MDLGPAPQILVVDDDSHVLDCLRPILLDAGYAVRTAINCCDAQELLYTQAFDLLLIDTNLLEKEGTSLISLFQGEGLETGGSRCRVCPVIAMGDSGDIGVCRKALQQGANDFVQKPVQAEHILLVVDRLMEIESLRDENAGLRRALEGRSVAKNELAERKSGATVEVDLASLEDLGIKELTKRLSAQVERVVIARALQHCDHNKTRAAQVLGISRRALISKVQGYALEVDGRRPKNS